MTRQGMRTTERCSQKPLALTTDLVTKPGLVASLAAMVLMCVAVEVSAGPPAEQLHSKMMVMAGLTERGMVTEIYERRLVIEGRTYEVDQRTQVWDDDGHEADLSIIVKGAEVRFRLKQDDPYKIDRIVVYLPR